MKQFSITLTESEIEALQICLMNSEAMYLQQADDLSEHNKLGINTKLIERKRGSARECERLIKLFDAIVY